MKKVLVPIILALFSLAVFAAHETGKEDTGKKPTTLRLKAADITAEITLENGKKVVITSKGTPMPPGDYPVKSVSIFKKDGKGKTWEIRTFPNKLGGLSMIMLDPEQDKVIDPGPPVALQTCGRTNGATHDVTISVDCHGQLGEKYYPGALVNGQRPPMPRVMVVGVDGKVIWTGQLTLSKEDTITAIWKCGSFKGKYTVAIEGTFGPFETKIVPTEPQFVVE